MIDDSPGRGAPLRLALYAGVCVRHDAISNSLRLKLDLVDRWRAEAENVVAAAFVHVSDVDDPRIHDVASVAELFSIPAFCAADLHIFEFGIYYPLFDAIFALPSDARIAAVYHNVTPPDLADDEATRRALERSLWQRYNLTRADHVAANSEFSREELIALGFDPGRVSVMPLPAAQQSAPVAGVRTSGPVELLFVGRFVRAKGVLDLLQAMQTVVRLGDGGIRLTLAGNPGLSSPGVLAEIDELLANGLADAVRFVPAPDDAALAALYASSDVFVIPSYHEGYCVPVIEALSAGCQVVAYDSSNLPFVVGGLGALVPTGDVAALAATVADVADRIRAAREGRRPVRVLTARGDLDEAEWRRRVAAHLRRHSHQAFEESFTELLSRSMGYSPVGEMRRPLAVSEAR
jgi:glycosyltransferase involved in cell wall biosynthesis